MTTGLQDHIKLKTLNHLGQGFSTLVTGDILGKSSAVGTVLCITDYVAASPWPLPTGCQ